jgi:hypothetical protein
MNRKRLVTSLGTLGLLSCSLLLSATAGKAVGDDTAENPAPRGYVKYLVFMANGVLPEDEVFIFGQDAVDLFHKGVMGRSDEEVATHGVEAAAFFGDRFGIDISDPRLLFSPVYFNPANNYRAYTVSDESVPPEGWVVEDGGWIVLTFAPITLDGDEGFAGIEVPTGTIFLYGDYSIEKTHHGKGHQRRPIRIQYEAGSPVLPPANAADQRSFQCLLTSELFGSGMAQGIVAPLVAGGIAQQNYRNVLTFSNLSGF